MTPLAVIDVGGGGGDVAAVAGHYTIITPELARGHVSSVPSGHPGLALALIPGSVYCYDQSSYESDDAHSSEPLVLPTRPQDECFSSALGNLWLLSSFRSESVGWRVTVKRRVRVVCVCVASPRLVIKL